MSDFNTITYTYFKNMERDRMRKKQELDKNIGLRIKEARESAGYTQEKLAEKVDVSVQHLAKLEGGRVGISVPKLVQLCQVLKISSDEILFEKKEKNDISPIVRKMQYLNTKQYKDVEEILNKVIEALDSK